MMKRMFCLLSLLALAAPLAADTFKHLDSGETFHGFRTTKQASGRTLVYRADQNKFTPLDLTEYQVSYGPEGRKDSVMVVSVAKPEILLSEVVSQMVTDSIQKAADTGTRMIVVQIDSPGGNGAYMKNIAQTIVNVRQMTGCPVAAYISGGEYGGAFSAAAVLALACDKIYIAPNAAIGTVGPLTTAAMRNEEYMDSINTFSPDSLATYSTYAASLATAEDRSPVLAKALVDKSVTALEVRDIQGSIAVVEESQRTNAQTVVRVVSEGISSSPTPADPAGVIQNFGKLLNLTAAEAVRLRMADKIVSAYPEILADMGLSDVQTVRAPGVEDTIQKFNAARRNLSQLMAGIQQNESRVTVLREQIDRIEEIARTGVRVRERIEGNYPINGGSRRYRDDRSDPYRNPRLADGGNVYRDPYGRTTRYGERDPYRGETVVSEEPVISVQQVQFELVQLLNETIPMYRRAIGISRRWPGALPPGVSVQTLEQNMDVTQNMLISLQRYLSTGRYPQ